jgi:hypothetical protein
MARLCLSLIPQHATLLMPSASDDAQIDDAFDDLIHHCSIIQT